MVASLEAAGFVADVSLRAATNDFRGVGTPDVLSQQYSRLKALIEETAGLNGGRAVTLISHSLGGPYTTLFLNEAPAAWKAQYIESFISLSSPVMGTAVTLEGIISGPMCKRAQANHKPQPNPSLSKPTTSLQLRIRRVRPHSRSRVPCCLCTDSFFAIRRQMTGSRSLCRSCSYPQFARSLPCSG
eukprot:6702651-Prymnesium_polylepis.1